MTGGLHHDPDTPRICKNPPQLLRGRSFVDGDRHRARRPQREVQQSPLVASFGHDGYALTGVDAGGNKALGDRGHRSSELFAGYRNPLAIDLAFYEWRSEERRVGREGRTR